MTLNDLEVGMEGVIVSFELSGMTLQRLISMGFMIGTKVAVVRKAPLLDPFDILVAGSLVAIRTDEAKKIVVKHVDCAV